MNIMNNKFIQVIEYYIKRIFRPNDIKFSSTPPIIIKVKAEKLSYLENEALNDLYTLIASNENNKIEGSIIETGCALGGSSIVIAKAKNQQRTFKVYDVFGMIPPPSEKDDADVHARYETIKEGESKGLDGNQYYGYQENLYEKVADTFNRFGLNVLENNIDLIKGLYEDTLTVNFPVSMAHIDCDWYDSVMVCLERIWPKLVAGGTLVLDDYYDWSGCRKATDDFFNAKNQDEYEFIKKSRLHVVKK